MWEAPVTNIACLHWLPLFNIAFWLTAVCRGVPSETDYREGFLNES